MIVPCLMGLASAFAFDSLKIFNWVNEGFAGYILLFFPMSAVFIVAGFIKDEPASIAVGVAQLVSWIVVLVRHFREL